MTNNLFISFIMPAKNASQFIKEAIDSVKNLNQNGWELIIIEDHSEDDTLKIANNESAKDDRIKVYQNIGKGKIIGLNYGYKFAKGDIIKCIDSDDLLSEHFLDYCFDQTFDAMCHNAYIFDSLSNHLANTSMSNKFLNASFDECFKYLLGLPRWTWTFNRKISNKIFPMPENLPYEDMWFSLIIKRYANKIINIKKPLYYYRQHTNQTYRGIYNYSKNIVIFRANRKLQCINVFENNYKFFYNSKNEVSDSLKLIKNYLSLMSKERISLIHILLKRMPLFFKLKLIGFKKVPFIVSLLKKMIYYLKK
jgi:glycosyltransferase involved in cell wall biosynthesis